MRRIKIVSLLLALVLAISLLAGCGGGETGTSGNNDEANTEEESDTAISTTSGAGENATEMNMWVFVELHSKFYQDMVERWNKANPDRQLKLNITTYPYADMHNKLQMALQSGTGAPDLCDIEISKFAQFMLGDPSQSFESLNDVVEPYKDSIVQSRLDIYSKDGKIYGCPTHVGATVMFYNTEILDKAGVDYKTIKTWDDYRAAGKRVVDATGKMMGVAETSAMWTLSALLAQQKSDYTAPDGKPNVNTPEAIRAVTLIQDMLKEGIIEVCPGGQPDTEEGYGYINQGNVASFAMPMWFMSRFTSYMPDLKGKIAIAPIPVLEDGMPRSVGLGGTGTVVTKTAKDPELAKEWLAWAKLSEEGATQIWNILGFDPANTKVWTDEAVTHNEDNPYIQYFTTNPFDVLNEIKDEIMLIKGSAPIYPAINNLFTTEVLNALYENGADPAQTLKDAQDQLMNEYQSLQQ